jgi:20S proteasome alpha/beta subunit
VTVCIAAIANYGTAIVIAADQMLTMGWAKSDKSALKIGGVHANFSVMFAGNIEHVGPVLRSIRKQLEGKDGPSYDDIENAASKAYQDRLREERENTVLGGYGVTLNEFLQGGPQRFGNTTYSQWLAEMDSVKLGSPDGLSLLVAGYDGNGGPHILSVEHPGVVKNHDIQGFWAIGSGQYGALSSLFFHSYNKRTLPEETVYHVAAAKFMAEESSSDVGKTTNLLIIEWEPPGGQLNLEGKVVVRELMATENVKKLWEKLGKPRIPKNLYQRMKSLLGEQGATQRAILGFKEKKNEIGGT